MSSTVMQKPSTGAELWAAVSRAKGSMPSKLRIIAGFITDSPAEFIRMTSREICARLGTSEPTLIRFCHNLGFSGLADFRIELALALAAQNTGMAVHPQVSDRRLSNPDGKRRIAKAALELLVNDTSVLIDNGTTAELLAELLGQESQPAKTIMTSGLMVAQNLLRNHQHKIILTGGVLRASTGSLSGRLVENSISGMAFDSFIMGADSIDVDVGLSTYSEDEAHITRAMVEAAGRVIVLADHMKFRRARLHRICGLQRIGILITDQLPNDDICRSLNSSGVRLIVADASGEVREST